MSIYNDMTMKMKVYVNEDDALLFWSIPDAIPECRGFAIERKRKQPGKPDERTFLVNRMGFENEKVDATTGPTLANDLLNLVGLRPAPPPLTMGWCVECHRAENATAGRHAPMDCVTCHH